MTQPPGTGSLVDQLNDLRRQVAELARKAPSMPACRAALTLSTVKIGSGDTFAQANWGAAEDPFGWFTPAAGGNFSYITVGLSGYYQLTYRSTTTGLASGAVAGSKVTLNAGNVANSVASDLVVSSGQAEGCVQSAFRARIPLSAGDRIFWSNYCSTTTGSLVASSFGIPTECTVQFISSR
ncbi:hypothetical protein [Amycolatopsis dendrobii]|uniref:Uncharacterized protein n=1 Tax=Amycolatopsis dendrobii TaxID=2760662 RepID=A0A7W3VV11_9PSEU|nr:hypothetical protein [Amycolatopsis dendrobii]MBB1153529.1 hypothetical protein [Amycolatopsis dendrobii]